MTAQINLYTPALLPQKPPLPAALLPGVAGLAVVCCLLLMGWTQTQIGRSQARLQQLQSQIAPLQTQVTETRARVAARKADPALEAEVKRLEQLVLHQERAVQVLRELERKVSLGFSEPLEALARQGRDGLWLTRVAWSLDTVELEGQALDVGLVPQWLAGLRAEPVMAGRSFQVLDLARPEAAAGSETREPVAPEPLAHRFRLRTEPGAVLPAAGSDRK